MATSAINSTTAPHLYDLRIHAETDISLKVGGLIGYECDEMLGRHIANVCDAFFLSHTHYQDYPLSHNVLEQFAMVMTNIVSTYGYPWVGNIVYDIIVNDHKTG